MNKKKVAFTAATLTASLGLLTMATALVVPSTSFSVQSAAEDQVQLPTIEVYSEEPDVDLTIVADFRNSKSYRLNLFAVPFDDFVAATGKPPKPTKAWIRMESAKSFHWHHLVGFEEQTITGQDGDKVATPSKRSEGTDTFAVFSVVLGKFGQIPSIDFDPEYLYATKNGPYVRFLLPIIDTPAVSRAPQAVPGAAEAPVVNGRPLASPRLGIWVTASPWDQLNPTLTPMKMTPNPTYTPPLTWQVRDRFIADILYRDSDWDRGAAVRIFIGGLAGGLGASALFLPFALISFDRGSETKPRKVLRKRKATRKKA